MKPISCQPVAPSGSTSALAPVCTSPSPVGRPHAHGVVARLELDGRAPLHPGVVAGRRGRARPAVQAPPSTATSTPVDADVLVPGARRRSSTSPAATVAPLRGTSIREAILTGPRSPQPRWVQYASKSVEAGDLHVDDPLGRRDVAVEAGHDHAHREAVLDRQRLAVHRHREHRVAAVGEGLERGAAGPAVVGGLQHGVGAGLRRRPRPGRRASSTPLHQALPIRSPPTGLETQLSVTQASVSSRCDQVVVGQRDLVVDHAVDAQLPVGGLDARASTNAVSIR